MHSNPVNTQNTHQDLSQHWSIRRLQGLDPHEHDFQEFKSSEWLSSGSDIQSDFLMLLSKQVSAFTNGAGGLLIIGMRDDGSLDQGVNTQLKGGTREWLEDVVSSSVTPLLKTFNVFEVTVDSETQFELDKAQPKANQSEQDQKNENGGGTNITKAIYIIDLPRSEEAPHQAKDHRYYLRVAGKSRPMSHLHLEDVIRRTSLPKVTLSKFGHFGEPEPDHHDQRGPRCFVMLRTFVHNYGRVMAKHVGVELTLPRAFIGKEVRKRMEDLNQTHYTQRPGHSSFFRYHSTPLFPTQEVFALCIWVCVHRNNMNALKSDAKLLWSVYADDSIPSNGELDLISFPAIRQAMEWVASQKI